MNKGINKSLDCRIGSDTFLNARKDVTVGRLSTRKAGQRRGIIIIDARLVSHEGKEVCTLEMNCPWMERRAKQDEEKTVKYGPMIWEQKQRYSGYKVEQYNVIIDVLDGYSKHLDKSVRKLLGARARGRTRANAEIGHLKQFEHCQNI